MDLQKLLENKELSPMMRQYINEKLNNMDCILFYRLGDFYEMFFDDANIVSKELELVLTSKDCGLSFKAPMCGVPYHSVDFYISKLIDKGYKIAIGEQVEDPKLSKGLVKREITKIVTPGTYVSTTDINNNFIICIFYDLDYFGVSISDFSTGDFLVTNLRTNVDLLNIIEKYKPKEMLFNDDFLKSNINIDSLSKIYNILCTKLNNESFNINKIKENDDLKQIIEKNEKYDLFANTNCINSSIGIYDYIKNNQKSETNNFLRIKYFTLSDNMYLDAWTIKNLELVENINNHNKIGSLFDVLNQTKTAMGARLLKKSILEPFKNIDDIYNRQSAIKNLTESFVDINELNKNLYEIYDIDRILTRIIIKSITPKEIVSFNNSLKRIPYIINILNKFENKYIRNLISQMPNLDYIVKTIDEAIDVDNEDISKNNFIKNGFDKQIDELRDIKNNGKQKLLDLEESEKNKNNIKNLKIKYSKVYGYLFEITNAYKGDIPKYFIRKQTLANAERYTTAELNELQYQILNADEKLNKLENEIFDNILNFLIDNIGNIKTASTVIAEIDMINSLSYVAIKNNYVAPNINTQNIIQIEEGRHPVIENINKSTQFIPNDTFLDNEKYIHIITGPNMAGKSTYMRQVAIICLMAHIGSFVPANSANICLIDRIFTRVGASDDLVRGQSTFLVEMNEVANIIDNATDKSLIILDEIGRGTSTYDGLSIAWSVVEYINDILKSKTLFATHYHELTVLENRLAGVSNYNITVLENNNDIKFLRKIKKGSADKSYGIAVAKLAGINEKIIKRANVILKHLNDGVLFDESLKIESSINNKINIEDNLHEDNNSKYYKIKNVLDNINLDNITPINSIMILSNIKKIIYED